MPSSTPTPRSSSRSRSTGKAGQGGRAQDRSGTAAGNGKGSLNLDPTSGAPGGNDLPPCDCWKLIDAEGGLKALEALSSLAIFKGPAIQATAEGLLVARMISAHEALLAQKVILERVRTLQTGGTGPTPTHEETEALLGALNHMGGLLHLWVQLTTKQFNVVNQAMPHFDGEALDTFLGDLQRLADTTNPQLKLAGEFLDYAADQLNSLRPDGPPLDIEDLLGALVGGGAGPMPGMPNGGPRVFRVPLSALAGLGLNLGNGDPRPGRSRSPFSG